ncbi:MAG: DUF4288 domain-containing protein [Planctomycetes bacterium]|nr:DUF4288 domain-containing protein [Planctomycetota bacterium]
MGTAKPKRAIKPAWYGVKTLFRMEAVGKPVARDIAYDATVSLVEERVVLFKARGFAAAIRAAEREARRYARLRYVNPYGQRVSMRYLGACEAFELYEAPGEQAEVFSTTEVVSKRIPDRTVVDQRLGARVDEKADRARRRIVMNREFSGSARRDGDPAMGPP